MSRIDQVLKWIWLGIGVALLLAMLWVGVFVAGEFIGGSGGEAVPAKPGSADRPRQEQVPAVRYNPPVAVRGTTTRLVEVRHGGGGYQEYGSSGRSRPDGTVVNVAFLDAAGGRLLLDRPGFIRDVFYPGGDVVRPEPDSLPPLRWILYEMTLDDTNGDRRLDYRDAVGLYATDLDGRGLRRLLPAGLEMLGWARQPDGSIVITALSLPPDGKRVDRETLPQRAFVMAPDGQVRPYAALDSLAAAAGRILRR